MNAVLMLSGGLDSYTAGAVARADGYELYALTICYGQVHEREVEAARHVARALAVKRHLELEVPLAKIGGSALVGEGDIPKDRVLDREADDGGIPSTYVPARNTVFLSLAMAWAEVIGAEAIVIGVNALDYSGYPDCRPEYLQAFERVAALATKAGVEGRPLRILAPLLHMTESGLHPLRHLAGPRLRPHPELLRSIARGTAMRPLRQLPVTGEGLRRGGRAGSI